MPEKASIISASRLRLYFLALSAVTTALSLLARRATADRAGILANNGESVDLLCKASAQESRLSYCHWKRDIPGQREIIIVNQEVLHKYERTSMDGIAVAGDGIEAVKCGLNMRKLTTDHFGRWSCTLVCRIIDCCSSWDPNGLSVNYAIYLRK